MIKELLQKDIGLLLFLIVNITLINLLAGSIGYNRLIIYWSLSIILIYLIHDLFYVAKYSLVNIRIFLLTGVLLWYYIPMLLTEYSSNEIVNNVIINYSLILMLVSKRFKVTFDKINFLQNYKRLYFLIFIYTCYKIYTIDNSFINHIFLSRTNLTADNYINLNNSILDTIIVGVDVIYHLLVSYGFYESLLKKKKISSALFLTLIIFISIESGFRSLMGFLLFPVIFTFIAKFKFQKIGISFIVLLIFAQFMLNNRTKNKEIFNDLNAVEAAIQTSDLYNETNYAIKNIASFQNVKQNDFFIYSTFVIPRAIFPSKPIPEVVRKFTLIKWGSDIKYVGGNVFPGVYMNFYLSYGLILGGLLLVSFQYFILYFFRIIYKYNNSIFFLALFCGNLLLNFRSNSPLFYFYTILPFAIITFYKNKKNENSTVF